MIQSSLPGTTRADERKGQEREAGYEVEREGAKQMPEHLHGPSYDDTHSKQRRWLSSYACQTRRSAFQTMNWTFAQVLQVRLRLGAAGETAWTWPAKAGREVNRGLGGTPSRRKERDKRGDGLRANGLFIIMSRVKGRAGICLVSRGTERRNYASGRIPSGCPASTCRVRGCRRGDLISDARR